MAQFETISHGEANWELKVNRNFSKVYQDSGWQQVPVLAPAKGTLLFTILNGVLFFAGSIGTDDFSARKIAVLPFANMGKNFIVKDITKNAQVSAEISADGTLTIEFVSNDQLVSFDGLAFYAGNITMGGSDPTVSTI